MSLRVVVADDEPPARRKLLRFLGEHEDVAVVAEATNGRETLDAIAATEPAVVFLDIHMPELDGLGVGEVLVHRPNPPAIVFVTAHDHYAVRAFEVSALDYLLKPYDRERFERSLERARRTVLAPPTPGPTFAEIMALVRTGERYARRILVPGDGHSYFIATGDIVRLAADGNNVIIHARRATHSLRVTLETLEARLDPERFARVHRSHVVNIDEIAEVHSWFHGDQVLRMRDGSDVPWSRRYAAKRPDLLT